MNGPPLSVNLQCFNLTRARHSVRKKRKKVKKKKEEKAKQQQQIKNHKRTCTRTRTLVHNATHKKTPLILTQQRIRTYFESLADSLKRDSCTAA